MTSFVDLFNPTFFMFLGILVLVVALLVVYFESKIRDQNHKIASMLSLVSTLAEDMNGVKMGLNHLSISGGQGLHVVNDSNMNFRENLGNSGKSYLIEVSDDEESNDEESNDEESDAEESTDEESNDEEFDIEYNNDIESIDSSSEDSTHDIKIVKIEVSNEDLQHIQSYEEEVNDLEFEQMEDLCDLDPEVDNEYVEEVLDLKYEETHIPCLSDLKKVSINLGEEHQDNEDNIDYKKLQLAKLRSVVIEKGLTNNSEASKMKKPELLKLLGAE